MNYRNANDGYGLVSIAFHWIAAVTILAMLITGALLWFYPAGPVHVGWVRTHVAIGTAMWIVVAARTMWHFIDRQPAKLSVNPVLNRLASTVHVALLLLIVFQLVSGPINIWSGGYPVSIYDWITVPNPMPGQLRAQHDAIGEVHSVVGWTIAVLVLLHFAGVAKHALIDQDGTLGRMLGRA